MKYFYWIGAFAFFILGVLSIFRLFEESSSTTTIALFGFSVACQAMARTYDNE